jgi:hypothetical protein
MVDVCMKYQNYFFGRKNKKEDSNEKCGIAIMTTVAIISAFDSFRVCIK